jgi:hypothetical protein
VANNTSVTEEVKARIWLKGQGRDVCKQGESDDEDDNIGEENKTMKIRRRRRRRTKYLRYFSIYINFEAKIKDGLFIILRMNNVFFFNSSFSPLSGLASLFSPVIIFPRR